MIQLIIYTPFISVKYTAPGPSCTRSKKQNCLTMISILLTWSWGRLLVSRSGFKINKKKFQGSESCAFLRCFSLPADDVLSAFRNLSSKFPNTTVPPVKLQEFLNTSFDQPGTEFESWAPPDWHEKWDPVFVCCSDYIVFLTVPTWHDWFAGQTSWVG